MSTPTVRLVSVEDVAAVERLLAANDLPTEGVRERPGAFRVAVAAGGDGADAAADGDLADGPDDDRVGVGGVEARGDVGLLRSVVVAEPYRGRGYGTALVRALESWADERGLGSLYLLTTTAAGFFAGLGYERCRRADVPGPIRETAEFSSLCPDSAAVMRRDLGG